MGDGTLVESIYSKTKDEDACCRQKITVIDLTSSPEQEKIEISDTEKKETQIKASQALQLLCTNTAFVQLVCI